jgi:hypothetical protein
MTVSYSHGSFGTFSLLPGGNKHFCARCCSCPLQVAAALISTSKPLSLLAHLGAQNASHLPKPVNQPSSVLSFLQFSPRWPLLF